MLNAARLAAFIAALAVAPALAEDMTSVTVGGDVYASGTSVAISQSSPRDVFMMGFSTRLGQAAAGNVHAGGMSVNIEAPVGGDLYASGFNVNVSGPVTRDVTAAGANLKLAKTAEVGGNVRMVGGNITVEAPISGSLVAAGGSVDVEGQVAGDARLTAGTLSFGPDARIAGTLTYSAPQQIEIAPAIVAPERVHFTKLEGPQAIDAVKQVGDHPWRWMRPSWSFLFGSFVVTIAFLVAIAAIFMSFAPAASERLRTETLAHPFRSLLLGLLGLATLIGLVPVSAMTVVGIPLIPVAILFIVVAWIGGYLLGAYALSWRVATAFAGTPRGLGGGLIALAIGLVVLALLNFIPVLGWIVNLAVLLFGLGGFAVRFAQAVAPAPVARQAADGAGGGI